MTDRQTAGASAPASATCDRFAVDKGLVIDCILQRGHDEPCDPGEIDWSWAPDNTPSPEWADRDVPFEAMTCMKCDGRPILAGTGHCRPCLGNIRPVRP